MKIPYRWVREFADLALGAADAADQLVNAGIEVASVTPLAPAGLAGVVVGEIEAIERELGESHGHRLLLCRVSTGSRTFSVICGAPNTKVGVRAAFAPKCPFSLDRQGPIGSWPGEQGGSPASGRAALASWAAKQVLR